MYYLNKTEGEQQIKVENTSSNSITWGCLSLDFSPFPRQTSKLELHSTNSFDQQFLLLTTGALPWERVNLPGFIMVRDKFRHTLVMIQHFPFVHETIILT